MTGKLFSPCHKAGWSTQPLLWLGVVQRQSRTKPQESWLPQQQGVGEREHPQIHPDGLGRAIPECRGPRGGSPDCKKGIHTLSVTSREWRGQDVTRDQDNRRQRGLQRLGLESHLTPLLGCHRKQAVEGSELRPKLPSWLPGIV